MKKSSLIIFILSLAMAGRSFSQNNALPEIGKPMPDFILDNITHYPAKKASLKDFEGKWLFLDFWFTTCVTCIQAFPKVNEFHKEFKDQLTWMMVGKNDVKYNRDIVSFYEKMQRKQHLQMPAAYDSVLMEKWNIYSAPHIIIIDPKGVVRFVTSGRDMTREKIKNLLSGREVSFYPKDIERPDFDAAQVTAVENTASGNDKILYRSVLTRWNGENQKGVDEIDIWVKQVKQHYLAGFNFAMIPLFELYNTAYFGRDVWWGWRSDDTSYYGKIYPNPVLEIRDSSLFQYDYNFEVGKGMYNYALTIPATGISKERVMRLMQEDLERVFRYEVSIEKRNMPAWKLVAGPGAIEKLKTKGGKGYVTSGTHAAGYTFINQPSKYLIGSISFYVQEKFPNLPFIDETGLTGNFDFTISADMTNIEDIKKELQKQGLNLVRGEKEMKVLVIRDALNL